MKHVVTVHKSFVQDGNGYIVMDYIRGGNLLSLFNEPWLLEENFVATLFYKICIAVKELHENNVAHLDLKLENILIEYDDNHEIILKICDFGSAMKCNLKQLNSFKGRCGSRFYLAPEILKKQEFYPEKADTWSLGVVLHVLLLRCFPVHTQDEDLSADNFTLNFLQSRKLSIHAKNLLKSLLDFNPQRRISINEILAHTWFIYHLETPQVQSNSKTSFRKKFCGFFELNSLV